MEDGFCTLRDDEITFQQAKTFWYRHRICAFCKKKFTLMDTFGTWSCRYHSQSPIVDPKDPNRERLIYPCCNEIVPSFRMRNQTGYILNEFGGGGRYKSDMPSTTGCVKADCREHNAHWAREDGISVTDFAAILPLMGDLESREGFMKADENAIVYRDILSAQTTDETKDDSSD